MHKMHNCNCNWGNLLASSYSMPSLLVLDQALQPPERSHPSPSCSPGTILWPFLSAWSRTKSDGIE